MTADDEKWRASEREDISALRIISQLKSPVTPASPGVLGAKSGASGDSTREPVWPVSGTSAGRRSRFVLVAISVLGSAVLFSPLFIFVYWLKSPAPTSPPGGVSTENHLGGPPTTINLGPGRIIPRAVYAHLLGIVKEPESLVIVACTAPVPRVVDGVMCWEVAVEYRSKNSFGGYVTERGGAVVRGDRVENWKTVQIR